MTLAALAAMLWSLPAAAQEEYRQPALGNPESWSVVVIPDLQGYAKNEASQPIARLMTAWIADNIERLNVRMVLCVGDVVEQNDRIGNGFSGDLTSVRQWQGMADAFDVLDGRVPYLVATGNHDYTYTRSGARRTHLNEYFPIGRNPLNAAAICQFGLDSDENPAVENCAFELKAPDGKDYLFLNMEFAPRDTVMKWAQQVAGLEEYADHRIVLMTHAYLDAKDQRLSGPCKVPPERAGSRPRRASAPTTTSTPRRRSTGSRPSPTVPGTNAWNAGGPCAIRSSHVSRGSSVGSPPPRPHCPRRGGAMASSTPSRRLRTCATRPGPRSSSPIPTWPSNMRPTTGATAGMTRTSTPTSSTASSPPIRGWPPTTRTCSVTASALEACDEGRERTLA